MWKESNYSKAQIDKAGKAIINPYLTKEERQKVLAIIDNWRAAHAYPMNTFAINLKKKVADIPEAIVAQRLKRLDTIVDKLDRFPEMQLSRMQDLGGCRVIVPTVQDVYKVRDNIVKSRIRHKLHNEKDYIKTPNPDTGYRGIHLIYRYKSDRNQKYNGLLTEIQIRTKLQHLWATAVETVGTFTKNGLKFNQGSEDWLMFFKLVAALFAVEEGTTMPSNINDSPFELSYEIAQYIYKLNFAEKIITIALVSSSFKSWKKRIVNKNQSGYFLLVLNMDKKNLSVRYFEPTEHQINEAIQQYAKIESRKTENMDAVLVSAQSIDALQKAYPNYFVNISDFANELFTLIKKYADSVLKDLYAKL